MAKLEGGCFCGAIRYALLAKPMIVHACHCLQCQNQTGTAFATNAVIEAKNVRVRGKPVVVPMSKPGERPHDIYRCAKCKVAVWSDYGRRGTVWFVRVGTLDNPAALPPDVHIWTRSAQKWLKLRGKNVYAEFYDPSKVWSAAGRARWKAATTS